jgi:hypothetical protein
VPSGPVNIGASGRRALDFGMQSRWTAENAKKPMNLQKSRLLKPNKARKIKVN